MLKLNLLIPVCFVGDAENSPGSWYFSLLIFKVVVFEVHVGMTPDLKGLTVLTGCYGLNGLSALLYSIPLCAMLQSRILQSDE